MAVKSSPPMIPTALRTVDQFFPIHAIHDILPFYHNGAPEQTSDRVRDVTTRVNERFPRHFHNPLLGAATCGRRQSFRERRDVRSDNGEVAVFEFPNIRTALAAGGFLA